MPVCNMGRHLRESMESVLSQTFADFEVCVVDFGSEDDTVAILHEAQKRDTRIKLECVAGYNLPDARNAAFHLSRGKYLAVMDADDVCLPQRLELQAAFLDRHPDVAWVGGATRWINDDGKEIGRCDFPTEDAPIRHELETRFPFCHPAVMMRREAFEAVGGYRRQFQFAHDLDLAIRICERYKAANLSEVVLKYRIHAGQVSFRKQKLQTMCRLASHLSRECRRMGRADPIESMREITEESLVSLGIESSRITSAIVADGRNWIRSMIKAGHLDAAQVATRELLARNPEAWQRADLYLTISKLQWSQSKRVSAIKSLCQAVVTDIRIMGRPLKALVHTK